MFIVDYRASQIKHRSANSHQLPSLSPIRMMALKFHPDKNPEETAKAKFQEISTAYKRLTEKRSILDMDSDDEGEEPEFNMSEEEVSEEEVVV